MKISVGILAWNEESSIRATLSSVCAQDVFAASDDLTVEIVCVANGCTDRTVEVANETICEHEPQFQNAHHARVEKIDIPSKENAWNEFVHRLSDPEADVFVFMDGDVQLAHSGVLNSLIEPLANDDRLWIAGGMPVKHIAKQRTFNPLHWVSLAASAVRHESNDAFGGCLYAARSDVMRRFCLPDVLIGEDCFIGAMIKTEFFTTDEHTGRVRRAPEAEVLFEAYTTPLSIYKNLRRRAVGLTIASMLYDELWAKSTKDGLDAGDLVMQWQANDPQWAQKLIRRKIQERGRWVLPRGMLIKGFRKVSRLRFPKNIIMFPVALCGVCVNLVPCIRANQIIRKGKMKNLWFVTQTRAVADRKSIPQ